MSKTSPYQLSPEAAAATRLQGEERGFRILHKTVGEGYVIYRFKTRVTNPKLEARRNVNADLILDFGAPQMTFESLTHVWSAFVAELRARRAELETVTEPEPTDSEFEELLHGKEELRMIAREVLKEELKPLRDLADVLTSWARAASATLSQIEESRRRREGA